MVSSDGCSKDLLLDPRFPSGVGSLRGSGSQRCVFGSAEEQFGSGCHHPDPSMSCFRPPPSTSCEWGSAADSRHLDFISGALRSRRLRQLDLAPCSDTHGLLARCKAMHHALQAAACPRLALHLSDHCPCRVKACPCFPPLSLPPPPPIPCPFLLCPSGARGPAGAVQLHPGGGGGGGGAEPGEWSTHCA